MLTHPVHIIRRDITLPLDQLNGHMQVDIIVPLKPDDDPDELRRYASNYIACYWDSVSAEQYGVMSPSGFRYTTFLYSRSS